MKKKYMILIGTAVILGGALLAGCGRDIGQNAAGEIALKDAGAEEGEASRIKVSRDKEDGVKVYEVEFDIQEKEYDYEIKASDGEILSADVDVKKSLEGPGAATGELSVSEADAKKAALDRVEGAAEQDLRMELDFEDGRYVYEGDIIYNQIEYEFEIDGSTGNFLKWSYEK